MGDIILILFALILLAVTYLLFTPLRIQIDFRFGEKFSAGSTIAMFPFRYRIAMGKGEKPKRAKKKLPRNRPSPGNGSTIHGSMPMTESYFSRFWVKHSSSWAV